MYDPMEQTVTSTIQLKIKHKIFIQSLKQTKKKFSLSKFIQEKIEEDMVKEAERGQGQS